MADNHKHTWVGSIACVWSTEVAVGNRICQHTSYRDPRHAVQTTQQLPVTAPPPPCVCVCVCVCVYVCVCVCVCVYMLITHFVDQAGLELRNLPAPASQVLGLKVCATTPSSVINLLFICLLSIIYFLAMYLSSINQSSIVIYLTSSYLPSLY